ncbi:hypothetical protein BpHYR1_025561 [Brachionus plicatilis]|uniref:Uncharacterized protein n=1 Tax=Brachionus plicatilis TaxID=10195 RepID=A0A3M7Q436_BRAPC|nr:hypothetical protein BpHYR1_025561 [Brachionus plicatilis]
MIFYFYFSRRRALIFLSVNVLTFLLKQILFRLIWDPGNTCSLILKLKLNNKTQLFTYNPLIISQLRKNKEFFLKTKKNENKFRIELNGHFNTYNQKKMKPAKHNNICLKQDDSFDILEEVFDDLDKNLYKDYIEKIDKIIDIYNNEYFLNKSNKRLVKFMPGLENISLKYEELKNKTLKDIQISVFDDGFFDDFKDFNLFEILNSTSADSYKMLFDNELSDIQKCDRLFSLIFESDTNNIGIEEYEPFGYKFANKKDAFSQNKSIKSSRNFTLIASLFVPPAMPVLALTGLGLHLADLQHRRKHGWYKNIEKQMIDYLKSSHNSLDIQKLKELIKVEKLEEDKDHFYDQFKLFFDKYNFNHFLDKEVFEAKFKIKKFHKQGTILMFESSWILLKALIFKKQDIINKQLSIERKLAELADNLDTCDYMPLVWFHLNETSKADENNLFIDFNCSSPIDDVKLKKLFSDDLVINDKTFEVKRESLYSFINILSTVSDFKFKSLLIKDFNIAIGEQVLFPLYNRYYGNFFTNDKFGFDLSSFTPTKFEKLMRGEYPYYCPNGWLRFSLKVTKSSEEFDSKYSNWPIAYHGTSSLALMNILLTGFNMSLGAHGRAVFQCRLNPNSFKPNKETLLRKEKKHIVIDPNFDNSLLEWLLTEEQYNELKKSGEESFLIYGIMVRISEEHPENLPVNQWWKEDGFKIDRD